MNPLPLSVHTLMMVYAGDCALGRVDRGKMSSNKERSELKQ